LPIQLSTVCQAQIVDQFKKGEYVNYEVSKVIIENKKVEEHQCLNQEKNERQEPDSLINKKLDKINSEGN
ncbi:MAG: hypothetical protein MHPSP_003576, partial [Paramarteilia canceri]